ncbi:MAG: Holliday junction DNA helicase RuvA [Candidatus Levybacteria bacterium RIFCSPLOWO2_02_FULL_37_10]|nr:MAG: Holliday junction DNA helicase RuvA [Candidatus Levybacteria bacterium RIFCSPHIGHO2_12_FULL_37_12]OGH43775.1 MAG: Holliday junction DNA helicase RuvA [Candidatus Levybacteria bacterium RIFCSPLOWO2_02_FULL_37_10]
MIALLKGKVEFVDGLSIILDVNGVGYRVLVPSKIFLNAKIKEELKLFIYTHVREDTLDLFGFADLPDLKLFQHLISVSGVGPKTALSIFSFGERDSIIEAIIKGDVDFFTAVSRLGRKNAQKIIIDLKTKLGSIEELDLSGHTDGASSEVLAVLKSFGFTSKESQDALRAVGKNAETTEEKIRLALKYLGK